MIDIVIPLAIEMSCDKNNELRYCLRSLEKNFKEKFRVIVIGNGHLEYLTNYSFIFEEKWFPTDKTNLMNYQCFFDTINKLDIISRRDWISEKFIYCYDDILLLREIDLSFFNQAISYCTMKDFIKQHKNEAKGRWGQTIYKAEKLFGYENKIQQYDNYETHIPILFEKSKLRSIFDKYNFRKMKVPYAPISLYMNTYFNKPNIRLSDGNNIININSIGDRTWVTYNDKAYWEIKDKMQEMFPNKSRFEV